MPKVVITHSVEDVDKWLKGKSERAEAIAGMGGSQVVDHAAEDGSSNVAVSCQTEDVGAMMAAIANPSPELAAAMGRHGVVPPLSVFVER